MPKPNFNKPADKPKDQFDFGGDMLGGFDPPKKEENKQDALSGLGGNIFAASDNKPKQSDMLSMNNPAPSNETPG